MLLKRSRVIAASICALIAAFMFTRPVLADDRLAYSVLTYGAPGQISHMEQTGDGGYIAAGSGPGLTSSLVKFDAEGKQIWTVPVIANILNDVEQAADGGYLFSGQAFNHFFFGKVNGNGQPLWTIMSFAVNYDGMAGDIMEVDDAAGPGILVTGYTRVSQGGELEAAVVRTTLDGAPLWDKQLLKPKDQFIYDSIPSADGGYILAGSTVVNDTQETKGYMVKIDALGSVQWDRVYGGSGALYNLQGIQRGTDGGYIVTGNMIAGSSQQMLLLKTASGGSEEWLKTYSFPGNSLGISVWPTKDGGYIVSGGDNILGTYLLKTDAQGVKQWDQILLGYGNGRAVTQLGDGSYRVAGGMFQSFVMKLWVGPPKGLTADDNRNVLAGMDSRMEYSLDNGATYTAFDTSTPPVFYGDRQVLVRYKADPAAGYEVGEPASYAFTADKLTEVSAIQDLHVPYGTPLSNVPLPDKVEFTLNGAVQEQAAVRWDGGSPEYDANHAGTYAFTGTVTLPQGAVNPDGKKAKINVVVDPKSETDQTVTDVAYMPDIYAPYGTSFEEVGLLDNVKVTLSSGDEVSVPVTWDEGVPPYDGNVPGTYTFTGTLVPPPGIINPDGKTAAVRIIVMAKEEPNPDEPTGIVLDSSSYRLEVGAAHSTVTKAVYAGGREEPVKEGVTYTSLQPDVATVDENGTVTGVSPGRAEIVVRYGAFTASANVEVWKTEQPGPGPGTGGQPPAIPVPPVADPSTSSTACGPAGCTAKLGSELGVDIPENAADSSFILTIGKVQPPAGIIPDSMKLLSPVFELTKSFEGSFKKPVTLHFNLQNGDLELGADRRAGLFYYDESGRKWMEVPGSVQGSEFTSEADHFAKYAAVFSVPKEAPAQEEPPQAPAVTFKDTAGHWGEEAIAKAASRGIVTGFPDGGFHPDQPVSRAEFTAMLMRALDAKGAGSANGTLSFKDKDAIGAWAQPAIAEAVSRKLIAGYDDGTFRPGANITRAEMVTMLIRALGTAEPAAEAPFGDAASIPAWAKAAASAALQLGIAEGRSGGKFEPDAAASRAEAVTMLIRMP
nr:DUF4073 domain-containing protein [Paenibacillus caui]